MKFVKIKLKGLSGDSLRRIFSKRVNKVKIGKSPFENEAVKNIIQMSRGNPYSLVFFSEQILNLTVKEGSKVIDVGLVEKYFTKTGILKSDILSLTFAKKRVLGAIWNLTSSESRNVSADDVADRLSITRSAVVQHLMEMRKKNIVLRTERGRRSYFHINPALLSAVDSYFGGEKRI